MSILFSTEAHKAMSMMHFFNQIGFTFLLHQTCQIIFRNIVFQMVKYIMITYQLQFSFLIFLELSLFSFQFQLQASYLQSCFQDTWGLQVLNFLGFNGVICSGIVPPLSLLSQLLTSLSADFYKNMLKSH